MKWILNKNKRGPFILSITLFAVVFAVGLDIAFSYLLQHQTLQKEDLIRAALIPIVIAPFISWYFVGHYVEQNKLKEEMTKLATYDDLTKLYNRRTFYHLGEKMHFSSVRSKQSYSLLAIDLDGFKVINDTYGHACGDKVLATFGEVSTETVRDSDFVSRLGGDEFVFFLPDTNVDQAKIFAERLCKKVRKKAVICESNYVKYTISIGVSSHNGNKTTSFDDIMRQSDIALYQAKKKGGNQTHCFTQK